MFTPRIFLILYYLIFQTLNLYSQDIKFTNKYTSPTNLSVGVQNNGIISTNLYTGELYVNIPLFEFKTRLNVYPLNLSYKANGVKVNDYSDEIGIKWSSNIGGSIIRVVNGIPDESINGYLNNSVVQQNLNGTYTTEFFENVAGGNYDSEPDEFILNVFGKSVSFYLNQAGTPYFKDNCNFKVIKNGILDEGWIFVDDIGTKLYFGMTQSTREIEQVFENVNGSPRIEYVNKWLLESIEDINSNDLVSFEYVSGLAYDKIYYFKNKLSVNQWEQCAITVNTDIEDANMKIRNLAPKYLIKIVSNNNIINLRYIAGDRQDIQFQYRLDEIVLFNNNNIELFTWKLNQVFTDSRGINDMSLNPLYKRMVLNSVTKYDSEDKFVESISFAYDNEKLPELNSDKTDHWGFYNNKGGGIENLDKNPDINYSKANILKEINSSNDWGYIFDYESHDYQQNQNTAILGGIRIKQITSRNNSKINIKSFKYTTEISNSISSGIQNRLLPIYQYDYIMRRCVPGINNWIPYIICYYFCTKYSNHSLDNIYSKDGIVGYSKVYEIEENYGYSEYKFTDNTIFPDEFNFSMYSDECFWSGSQNNINYTNNVIFNQNLNTAEAPINSPTSNSNLRGHIKERNVYNNNGEIVSKYIYNYEVYDLEVGVLRGMSISTKNVDLNKYQSFPMYISCGSVYHVAKYNINSKNLRVTNVLNVEYHQNKTFELAKEYFYENSVHNYVTKEVCTFGPNKKIIKKYKYVNDIDIGGQPFLGDENFMGVFILLSKNAKNNLIEKSTYLLENGIEYVLSSELYTYKVVDEKVYSSNLYLVEGGKNVQNLTEFNFTLQSPHLTIMDSRYRLQTSFLKYDGLGRVIQLMKDDGINYSFKYNGFSNHKIAEFINASTNLNYVGNECSFVNFESKLNSNLNSTNYDEDLWINIEANNYSNNSHTGQYSYIMNGNVSNGIVNYGPTKNFLPSNQNQKYKLSAWVKTPDVDNIKFGELVVYTIANNESTDCYPLPSTVNYESYKVLDIINTNNEWKYIELIIDLDYIRTTAAINDNLLIRCFVSNTNSINSFLIDDISFQPVTSQSISYSYANIFNNMSSIINYDKKVMYHYYNSSGGEYYSKDHNGNIIDLKLHTNNNKVSIIYESLVSGIVNPNFLLNESLPNSQYKKHVYFKDGLGNLIQENLVRFSPTNKDLIVNHYYDDHGLPTKNYLPYTINSNNGISYRSNFINEVTSFYSSNQVNEPTNFPFGEVVFDNSPIKKINEISSPGNGWRIANGHTKKYFRFINSENEIKRFSLTNNSILLNDYYSEGELLCEKFVDENNQELYFYYDKLNNKVCEKRIISSTISSYTYFIFDENSRLVCTISPKGYSEIANLSNITLSSSFIRKWCQYYKYDSKGRITHFQLSSIDPKYFVYNKTGKLVLQQDPNLRAEGKWIFYKYDVLGRLIMKGIKYLDPSVYTLSSLQNIYDNNLYSECFETVKSNGIVGYSNISFPNHTESELFYVAYYEKPFSIIINSVQYISNSFINSQKTIEMNKIIQSDFNNSNWFKTYFSYNDKLNLEFEAREIESGYLVKNYTYDFRGNLLSERDNLFVNQVNNEFIESYTFDNYSRLKSISCKFNNAPSLILSNYFYDELGNNIKKNVGINNNTPLFSTEFKYSIRNWITELNSYYTQDQIQCETAKLFEEQSFREFILLESDVYPIDYRSNEEYILSTQIKIVSILNELGFPDDKFIELLYDDIEISGNSEKEKFQNQYSISLSELLRANNINNPMDDRSMVNDLLIFYINKLIEDKLLTAITYLNCYPIQMRNNLYSEKLYFEKLNPTSSNQNLRYDGNITSINTKILNSNIQFDYNYDNSKQLRSALYSEKVDGVYIASNKYNLFDIDYDFNGNLLTFKQNGSTNIQGNNYGLVDFVTFDYSGNRLLNIEDQIADNTIERNDFSDGLTSGFGVGSNCEYLYDDNGNLVFDKNKGLTIKYNLLGYPYEYLFADGNKIGFYYTTNGEKIRKTNTTFSNNHGVQVITDYVDKYEFSQGEINTIYLEEGRLVKNGSNFQMEYVIKDHLGNSRMIIKNNNNLPQIIQTLAYTPYGNLIPQLSILSGATDFAQKFNGKELVNDLQLNLYDFGPRDYNPQINRWNTIDASAVKYPNLSEYNFALNDPVNLYDPDGNDPTSYQEKQIARGYIIMEQEMRARNGEYGPMAKLEMFWKDYARDVQKDKLSWLYDHLYYEGDGQNSDPTTFYGLFNKVAGSFLMFTPFGTVGALAAAGRAQNYYAGAVAIVSLGFELGGVAALGTRASGTASMSSKVDNFAGNSFRAGSSADNFAVNSFRGVSSSDNFSVIYRAASQAEVDDIAEFGLRMKTGGYESAKLFAPTLEEATQFGKYNYGLDGIPNTVLEVEVPNSVLEMATKFSADGMNAISVPAFQLPSLQSKPLNFSLWLR